MATKDKKIGKQTVKLENPPKIISTYSIVGPKEGDGPLRKYFHKIIRDDTLGKDSFEKPVIGTTVPAPPKDAILS